MKEYFKYAFKYTILYLTGGIIYLLLELAVRGRSDITMVILGGLCFVLIGCVNEWFSWKTPLIKQALVGGFLIVTPLELLFGLIFNQTYTIWDYTNMPFNYLGQICLTFSFLWCILSIVAIILDDYLRYYIFKEEKPRYKIF